MPSTASADRQQFNLFIDKEIVRLLKLRAIHEDSRLNILVEKILSDFLTTEPDGKVTGSSPSQVKVNAQPSLLPTVIINVDDMARSTALYRDLLGLPCRQQGNRWTEFNMGGHALALHVQDAGGAAKANGVITLCLEVADLDAAAERVAAAGYKVEGPAQVGNLGRLANFRDLDGVAISLTEAKEKIAA
jgi:predicted enzyme related to lactoylglutathione lyase